MNGFRSLRGLRACGDRREIAGNPWKYGSVAVSALKPKGFQRQAPPILPQGVTRKAVMKSTMSKWASKRRVLWVVGLMLGGSALVSACASDESAPPTTADAGARDDAGSAGVGEAGASHVGAGGDQGDGGAAPVNPTDLVCTSNADCNGVKPVCDPVQGCVACLFDWNCPANHRCEANQCFKKQACTETSDCTHDEQPVCDPVQGMCVGCREDSECGDDQRCAGSRCTPLEKCKNSHDCSEGRVCDRVAAACVACVVDGDCGAGNACVADTCVPTCTSDKECLGIGRLCDLTAGRCVECVKQTDCPDAYFCGAAGICQLDVCEQGTSRCNGSHTLASCTLLGDRFEDSTCSSNSACTEDGSKASCTPFVCNPSSVTCATDGSAIVTCSGDGLSVKSTAPCGAGKTCVAGACQDVICPPATFSCDGSDLYACNQNGTAKSKTTTCGKAFRCDAESGSCVALNCTPGAAVCDGNAPTTCALDGSGPVPGGIACADGSACTTSGCLPIVCTGAYQCNADGSLYKCSNNGTTATLSNRCNYQSLCDAVGAKCITPTCTPGAFVCNGNVATRCKADGSGYESAGTDCTTQNLVCDGGGCLPKACTPSTIFCDAGNPLQCNAAGTTYTPTDTCATSEYCSASSTTCLADKCSANAAVCNGNLLTTCAADGSGPVAGGTDCTESGKLCVAGACKPAVCTPGSLSCQNDALYKCDTTGTGTTLYQTCSTSQFCDASEEAPTSATDICTAGALGCNSEVVSTCGSNGGSWTNPGTNCAASSQVCVVGGSCAAQEVSTQGSSSYNDIFTSTTQLSAFRALNARKLNKLEIYGSVSGLQKFTWVVYQKRANASSYDLVYQSVTSQTALNADWVASPALNFTFSAGKTYAVGVHITGPARIAFAYSTTTAKAGFITAPAAAQVTDGTQPSATLSSLPTSSYQPYLRFTTALAQ